MLFMSLKCTQTKIFAPGPRQHSDDRATFSNEKDSKRFPVTLSFFTFVLSLVVIMEGKKNLSNIQVNFIST